VTVVRVEIVDDRTDALGSAEGFLKVRRWVLRNVHDDGTFGEPYRYDVLERDALDAVAIAAWERGPAGVQVWLRGCLRPPLLSRARVHVPLPWSDGETTVLEVPAGLVDAGEVGWEGVRAAAARELQEETGIVVPPSSVRALGAPFFLSPGVLGEMIFPVSVEVAPGLEPSGGHGAEEVERGAAVFSMPLAEALARVQDGKSEIVLRRLADSLP